MMNSSSKQNSKKENHRSDHRSDDRHGGNRRSGDRIRWGSLRFRLSLVFAILLMSVSAVYFYLMSTSSADYLAEMMQKRNIDLAASIA